MLLTRLPTSPPSLRSYAAGGVCFSGGVLWLLSGLAGPAWGANAPPTPNAALPIASAANAKNRLVDFNLPAQPLESALERYGVVSGQSVMVVDSLVAGRESSPVQGRYTPRAALQALLMGTGLVAIDVSRDQQGAFTLRLAPGPANVRGQVKLERSYDGMVQARVWEALCDDVRSAPGRYRAILRFFVSSSGRVHQASLIYSTGDGQADAAILSVLAQVQLDRPPPPNLAQPLTLVILPHNVLPGPVCQREH